MIEAYKSFIQSSDLAQYIDWIKAIQNDDLGDFLTHFNPSDNPIQELFDPIEVVTAYQADRIFNHLLIHEDYSHFYTPFNLSILQVFAIFKNESYLFSALSQWAFDDDDLLALYDYIIQYGSASLFKKVYASYPLKDEDAKIDLFRISLDNESVFFYLKKLGDYQAYLTHQDFIYDIVGYFPQYLDLIKDVDDVSFLLDTDVFKHVFSFENEEEFYQSMDYMLKRNIDINACDAFGLCITHNGLRHAKKIKYLDYLSSRGAKFTQKTKEGFPSSHQLYLRDARFILESSHLIDFGQVGPFNKTLTDLDDQDEKEALPLETSIEYVCMALNVNTETLYEYNHEELESLLNHHNLSSFKPSITLIEFESIAFKEAFEKRMSDAPFEMIESDQLAEIFQTKFNHDKDLTLQLFIDFEELEAYEEEFSRFVFHNQTKLIISSEGYEINQLAHIEWVFSSNEQPYKRAVVYSTLLDVYMLHQYFKIPFENIVYQPIKTGKKHYLS